MLSIDIRNDTVDFPTSFCRACRRAMCKSTKSSSKENCIQVYGKAISHGPMFFFDELRKACAPNIAEVIDKSLIHYNRYITHSIA